MKKLLRHVTKDVTTLPWWWLKQVRKENREVPWSWVTGDFLGSGSCRKEEAEVLRGCEERRVGREKWRKFFR